MGFELLFLALASAFWPLLLAVTVAALASARPVVVLGFFILGGLLTCITVGVTIVYLLRLGHALSRSNEDTLDPVVYYVGAILSFIMAAIVQRLPAIKWRPRRRKKPASTNDTTSRLRNAGPVAAFSVGVVANVFPGIFPFIAMKDIAELDVEHARRDGHDRRLLRDHVPDRGDPVRRAICSRRSGRVSSSIPR